MTELYLQEDMPQEDMPAAEPESEDTEE